MTETIPAAPTRSNRSYYDSATSTFLDVEPSEVVGKLASMHSQDITHEQTNAWQSTIEVLKSQLRDHRDGHLYLEFLIPRMGFRADAILVFPESVIVIEFKTGEQLAGSSASRQVESYALDLNYFHSNSHNIEIYTLVVTPDQDSYTPQRKLNEHVHEAVLVGYLYLSDAISQIRLDRTDDRCPVAVQNWAAGRYLPSPTIIEAARALYAGHAVEDITKTEADAAGLAKTSTYVSKAIHDARVNRKKIICFVTGVPGAGKTLVGLNVATSTSEDDEEHAVYLSGNGPLVEVLQEALAIDDAHRTGSTLSQSRSKARAYIQNIHHFRDEYLNDFRPPAEQVVIFDEAQRAWDAEQASAFMSKKKNVPNFVMSEPEYLLSVMDRHESWAAIICLVGGGQEINKGEAGIGGWIDALNQRSDGWEIHLPEEITDDTAMGKGISSSRAALLGPVVSSQLHLATSQRSFRAESLSEAVHWAIAGDSDKAKSIISRIQDAYPIRVTRNLQAARDWVRRQRLPNERMGLLASSKGYRLLADGVHVKNKIEPTHWFLKPYGDVRSSNALELVGTEFDVQGLEVDWAVACWDGDYRLGECGPSHWSFRGNQWNKINVERNQRYLQNAYRVILTRARQGMVIFVPPGSTNDASRNSAFYDPTYEFWLKCGALPL